MKITLLAALAWLFAAGTARGTPLEVGARAPSLTALDQEGRPVQLGELYDKGLVLVYFYPKAGTRGCTAQACSLRDAYEKLTDRGVTVVGVSTDNSTEQKAFHDEYALPFTLIADADHKVVDAFGVPLRGPVAARQAFLIKGGVVVWRDLAAATDKQADDVLAALDTLGKSPPAPTGT